MTHPPLVWTLEETGRQLGGLSARSVRRLVDAGLLPAVPLQIPKPTKGGGLALSRPILMIRPEDARAYLDSLMDGADNPLARDKVPTQQEASCPKQKVSTTRTAISGQATPQQAERELGALLGFPSAEERRERKKRKP